jgi:hypothetical protein
VEPRYSVRSAALVPYATPPPVSAYPLGEPGASAVTVGSTTLGFLSTPKPGAGQDANVLLPRHDVRGMLRFQGLHGSQVALVWDQGLDDDALTTTDDQSPPGNGDAMGMGILGLLLPGSGAESLRGGFLVELMLYSLPYQATRTCVQDCLGIDTTEVSRELTMVAGFGGLVDWHVGPFSVFGILELKNHPTTPKSPRVDDWSEDHPIDMGPFNILTSAGVEASLPHGFRLLVQVSQPLTTAPLRYGPTLGATLTIPLAKGKRPAPQAAATPRAQAL